MMTNTNANYENMVKSAVNNNQLFTEIIKMNIAHCSENSYKLYYDRLERGKAILKSEEECNLYMAGYGHKHYYKMQFSYETLFKNFTNNNVDVFDWGAGQAMASCVLLDFFKTNKMDVKVNSFTLVEPSTISTAFAKIHLENLVTDKSTKLNFICKKFENVMEEEICANTESIKLHLFSNILDMEINSQYISEIIRKKCKGTNIFICVSPNGYPKMEAFSSFFANNKLISKNCSSFNGSIFLPSHMKYCSDIVYRHELIFKNTI